MPEGGDVIYLYDGSYPGLLCCVFRSVYARETPFAIQTPGDAQGSLFPQLRIATEADKAQRVHASIRQKIGPAAQELVRDVFLSCAPEKEMLILRFLRLGYKEGPRVMAMLAHAAVQPLLRAQLHLHNETHLLTGFLRFSDSGGTLVGVIEPKNFVLPYLQPHFCARFMRENFLIYDRTHKAALLYRDGQARIVELADLTPPEADAQELRYRALWRKFYDTVAIAARENPRLRMTHCAKRYWANMTELASAALPGDARAGEITPPVLSIFPARLDSAKPYG